MGIPTLLSKMMIQFLYLQYGVRGCASRLLEDFSWLEATPFLFSEEFQRQTASKIKIITNNKKETFSNFLETPAVSLFS